MTVARDRKLPQRRQPVKEHEVARSIALGFEAPSDAAWIRCLAHGFPTPLALWHFHEEYELHLITATTGKAFVGDWIGPFEPGHLVLCGPRLPHNWISMDVPDGGVSERDLVIQFRHDPIAHAAEVIPEIIEVMQLFERAKQGIEFFGMSERAYAHWHAVKQAQGMHRFAAFCDLLADLAQCTNYRLLSHAMMQGEDNNAHLEQINLLVDRITGDVSLPVAVSVAAAELGMSESQFSRFFRRTTGNTFVDFVNRARVKRACQLLMETDLQVTRICYDVGFQNVANFNRRFRDIKGMTPTEFRQEADVRFGRAS